MPYRAYNNNFNAYRKNDGGSTKEPDNENVNFEMNDPIDDAIAAVSQPDDNDTGITRNKGTYAGFDLAGSINRAKTLGEQLYGDPDSFGDEDREKLKTAQSRSNELQSKIREPGVQGSFRIRGNPYSVDTRQLLTGAMQLVDKKYNQPRREELGNTQDEIKTMQLDKAMAQQTKDNIGKFMGNAITADMQNHFKSEENVKDRELKESMHKDTMALQERMQEKDFDFKRELQELENSNSPGGRYYASVVGKAAKAMFPEIGQIEDRMEATMGIINDETQHPSDIAAARRQYEEYVKQLKPYYNKLAQYYIKTGMAPEASWMTGGQGDGEEQSFSMWDFLAREQGQEVQVPYKPGVEPSQPQARPQDSEEVTKTDVTDVTDIFK